MTTLVVDITYRCNSPCQYCRWGSTRTPGREDLEVENLLLPRDLVERLDVGRVVLSGGEPLLHPNIEAVLSYYETMVPRRIVITNGLALTDERRHELITAGANGFTFSVDSIANEAFAANRGLGADPHARILSHLQSAAHAAPAETTEIGVNAVVTSSTAAVENVAQLLEHARDLGLSFVKFSPVFDDGFLSQSAPELALAPQHADALAEIGAWVSTSADVPTNPPGFWHDLASLARGRPLPGDGCGLGPGSTLLLVRGQLTRCFWVDGAEIPIRRQSAADAGLVALNAAKPRCIVRESCFCMQPLPHVWNDAAAP